METTVGYDPLQRFLKRQEGMYEIALQELCDGKKVCHWMWYIFPQLRGLGQSRKAWVYGIEDLAEAKAYLTHPVLGQRLTACCKALLRHRDKSAEQILGDVDAVKLRSSMTLFQLADEENPVFAQVLEQFFDGKADWLTQTRLSRKGGE